MKTRGIILSAQVLTSLSRMPLIGKLFDGPIDIVGDVHGETGALCQLLFRLGYDGAGRHPDGRHLVFVGDLTDRGPDSPGAVRLVRSLVENGAAQMVLGNHELNLMRRDRKHGNHWFWGETEQLCKNAKEANHPIERPAAPSFQVLGDPAEQDNVIEFFQNQPLLLERPGMAVVHAMYHKESVDALRGYDGDAYAAYEKFEAQNLARLAELETAGQAPSKDDKDMLLQNENPVKVLTSGMEVPAKEPFFAGGKMRTLERSRWWENYGGEGGLVVIGHFWRRRHAAVDLGFAATGPSVFPRDTEPGAELAALGLLQDSSESICNDGNIIAENAVVCVDYSIGLRYEERGRGLPEGSCGTALAALRIPERTLHFADGEIVPLKGIKTQQE